jgi:DNA-binding LacI/PurR family transcriptional regulator
MASHSDGIQGRPTLADVAARAGVSQATVSRALADSPLVNEQTRRRVWEVAERLAFQPNRLARSLRRGATMAIGLVVPDVATAFYSTALKGVQEVVEAAGYHVLVVSTERDARREREAFASLRAHQVDGVIVATSGGYESLGVPAVFIDNVPAAPGTVAVALDNAAGVALLVEHLVSVHGQSRIAYVGPPETVGSGGGAEGAGRERLEAFRAAIGRAGLALPPEYVRLAGHVDWEGTAPALTAELLALPAPPDAIVAGADLLALGVLRGLRDGGRRVPEDVALVSFDEPVFADLLDPPVTSLDRHDREIGRRAGRLLLDALTGAGPAGDTVERVPLTLHARRSCGCGG